MEEGGPTRALLNCGFVRPLSSGCRLYLDGSKGLINGKS
jgi:hypothetical protein